MAPSVPSPEQQLEQAIMQNPADLDKYIDLAALYEKADKFDRAEAILQKGLAASGGELPPGTYLVTMEVNAPKSIVMAPTHRL